MSNSNLRANKFSSLALIETIIASTIAAFLAWKIGSIKFIILSSCISPFLLIRSKEITVATINNCNKTIEFLGERSFLFGITMFFSIVGVVFAVNVYTTIVNVAISPIKAIKMIPENYYYNVFVLDFRSSPKMIPGVEEVPYALKTEEQWDLYALLKKYWISAKEFTSRNKLYFTLLVALPWILSILPIILPITLGSLLLRYSVKSTAIVWLPLLWVLYQSNPGKDVDTRLNLAVEQPWFKVTLVYSLFVVASFLFKLYVYFAIIDIHLPNSLGPLKSLGDNLIDCFNMPLWQVAGFINALLALILYNEAKKNSIRTGTLEAWPDNRVRALYSFIQSSRSAISIYTVSCFIYIMFASASNREWPAVRLILFPWS
ncbi:hypothetical protein [Methylobacterium sp. J-070]|uniref:hypothetical protein n=1 Tax=Methylobacterium sp. J-070 TaxID=2836650 RepID=UPI001FB9AD35|nr:hypothetical protein [Methylobacterium sp. J-070]MCJ2053693.1 hypothetical protein [Methylobacterium sp. J-070]